VRHLLDEVVFKTSDREYRWRDVVLAARLCGEWERLERRVRQDLACRTAMRTAGQTLDADKVKAAAEQFRYDHDLLTAEETDQWLERWGLSVEAWMDYIQRVVLRDRSGYDGDPLLERYAPSTEEVERAMAAEAVCSGELTRLARRLAGRAAVFSRLREAGDPGTQDSFAMDADESPDAAFRAARGTGDETQDVDGTQAYLERLESHFNDFARQIVTATGLADRLVVHQDAWTRVECLSLLFDQQDRANEAAMLVREDREPPETVASAAGATVQRGSFYLGDLEPELRDRLRSARPGDWSGPFAVGNRFVLFLVHEKVLPTLNDPNVRRRAERARIDAVVEREIDNRVAWCRRL
jgi:hypothetical protein